jgi:hypothetical protein
MMERYMLRYVPKGTRAHLLPNGMSNSKAVCGLYPWTTGWWGTGSQEEYDRAANLPLCQRCAQLRVK